MRPYELLKNFGIEYLEIRGIDLSPHDITGISKHHMRFLDLVLIYCLIKDSPKISSEEKDLIDKNDQATIYGGRNENIEVFIDGEKININAAKEKIFKELKEVANFFNESEGFLGSINYVKSSPKGEVTDKTHHQKGLEQAKINLENLKSDTSTNINSIKKEAELSLNELNKIPINSKEEMDGYVRNYNLDI
jgi:glutamate--cysteine ligase